MRGGAEAGLVRQDDVETLSEALEAPATVALTIKAGAPVPASGPLPGEVRRHQRAHKDTVPSLMMAPGSTETVLFGLATQDFEFTPLYAVTLGEEDRFARWIVRYAPVWGTPFETDEDNIGQAVGGYRDRARAMEQPGPGH